MPPTNGTKRQSGVILTQRMQAAGNRACEAYRRVQRIADNVSEEIEDVTSPHGVPIHELDEEDSVVIVVKEALAAHAK